MIRSYRTSYLALFTALTATSLNLSAGYAANTKQLASNSDKGTQVAGQPVTIVGNGGENHQTSGADLPTMTTQQGIAVSDDQNSLKVGADGPVLLEDFAVREKIFHFDHERIPERVVHARGYGVHGYFEPYESLSVI